MGKYFQNDCRIFHTGNNAYITTALIAGFYIYIEAFDLDEQGNVATGPRPFASAQRWADEGAKGLPDGMAMDVDGNLWATGPGGVFIIDPQGKKLGLVETGTATANCAFGGEDGSTLYITSHKFLARIKTQTKGIEFR